MSKKRVKKRLNIKRTMVVIILLYIVFCMINHIFTSPIRHIEIIGNNIVKDKDIIVTANLKDYPSIMKYSSNKLEKKISKIDLIENVKVRKKIWNVLSIEIIEKRFLFYYLNQDKIVLNDGQIVENNYENLYGIPVLINEVDENIMKEFVKDFNELKDNIIYEINEIIYFPKYNEDVIINDKRFKIIMNDGNEVIVNTNTVSILNKYNDIYSSLNDVKGTIDLDSNKVNNLVFTPFEVKNEL